MKHLYDKDYFYKYIEEEYNRKYDYITNVCSEHLADLLYDGFKIIVSRNFIRISKDREQFKHIHIDDYDNSFKWSSIADDVIMFCEAFKDEYKIKGITIYYKQYTNKERAEIPYEQIEMITEEEGVYCLDLNVTIT